MSETRHVTRLLHELSAGDSRAMKELIPLIYDEMRMLADRALRRERPDHTLAPTGLVHEAYMQLVNQHNVQWQDRSHFLAIAAQMMRRILVDHARQRDAHKRGGALARVGLDTDLADPRDGEVDLAAVDEAVSRLAEFDAPLGQLVELRFFGGLTIEETADVLGESTATVKRDWNVAKAWLRRELGDSGNPPGTRE